VLEGAVSGLTNCGSIHTGEKTTHTNKTAFRICPPERRLVLNARIEVLGASDPPELGHGALIVRRWLRLWRGAILWRLGVGIGAIERRYD